MIIAFVFPSALHLQYRAPLTSSLPILSVLAAASLSFAAVSSAATIDWGLGARDISGDSDVDASGMLLAAYNFGAGDGTTTINGVTFQNVFSPDFDEYSPSVTLGIGPGSVTLSGVSLMTANAFGAGREPFTSLSAPYRSLLDSAVWNEDSNDNTITFTLHDLTPGQTYRIQVWVNDSRYLVDRSTTLTAGNSVTLQQNTGVNIPPNRGDGDLGQFVIGTFVADATTQIFVASSSVSTNVNGLTISAVTPVPEPALTSVAVGAALLGILALRRLARRRA